MQWNPAPRACINSSHERLDQSSSHRRRRPPRLRGRSTEEEAMADRSQPDDTRLLWITGLAIIVLLVGGMGINMLVHRDTTAQPAEMSNPAK
jgi:hypothetical protein